MLFFTIGEETASTGLRGIGIGAPTPMFDLVDSRGDSTGLGDEALSTGLGGNLLVETAIGVFIKAAKLPLSFSLKLLLLDTAEVEVELTMGGKVGTFLIGKLVALQN